MKIKTIGAIALIVFVLAISVSAQSLPRRGALGVAAQPLTDAVAASAGLKSGQGLNVTMVVPGGTFDKIGIKPGDIVLSVNGSPTGTQAELVAAAQKLTEGDKVAVEIISGGTKSTKSGVAVGRPRENSDVADVNYDEVEMSLGTLRTITYIPKTRKPKMPAVFYIQGLPCQSHELGPDSKDPRKQAFDDWVRAGFVVFRVERPGLGDSKTTKECRDIDFNEEIDVNKAGYKKLLSYDFVDNDNVFFFGHSMGGWTAPIVAQMKAPRGIIVYGTGVRSWFEYFIDLFRIQPTYGGGTHVAAEKETRELIPLLYEWLEAGKSAEEMRKNPALKKLMDEPGMFDGEYFQGRAAGRSARFFHTMSKQNLVGEWSKVTSKVLAMYGEFDVQALNARDAVVIAEIVNQANPGNGEFMLLPKTEHIFARAESYKQVSELYATGKFFQYASTNYNPEFSRVTNDWMIKNMK